MYIGLVFSHRVLSSVGLEHLPYKQRVVGSNPTEPTDASEARSDPRAAGPGVGQLGNKRKMCFVE